MMDNNFKVRNTVAGNIVHSMTGRVLASFSNDEQSQYLYGQLTDALARNGATLIDQDSGCYIIGTMDQLLKDGA